VGDGEGSIISPQEGGGRWGESGVLAEWGKGGKIVTG